MRNNITNYTRKLHYVGEVKSVGKKEKKAIIKEALDLGFPFRDTLNISRTTYPEYIEMLYPDENLETYELFYDNSNTLGYTTGDEIDLIQDEGVYGIQYKVSKELGFYSEMCLILFYDGCYRFIDTDEAKKYLRMFYRHKKINEVLPK